MVKHTQEPWHFDKYGNIIAGEEQLLLGGIRTPMSAGPSMDEGKANARRIVACVNACRGLPTHELEQKGLVAAVGNQLLVADDRAEAQEVEIRRLSRVAADAENQLADALNQRDELLAALDWNDAQIMEFISIAFRHAEIRGDFELSDVRDALNMVKSKPIAKVKGGAHDL